VEAVALGGSLAAGQADEASDVDLYVYLSAPLPLALRAAVAAGAERLELDNRRFEPGDEWVEPGGVRVDAMFRETAWIEEALRRVLDRHQAALGATTALWHNVATCRPLFDRRGWLAALRRRALVPYPEPLRRAVVAANLPLLSATLSSYRVQLEAAAARGDRVSLAHRTAAFLASAFDVLFALNRLTHPGEKRLLAAAARCPLRPPGFEEGVERLVSAAGAGGAGSGAAARALAEGLEALARREGLSGDG
jgi:hypothetical protein